MICSGVYNGLGSVSLIVTNYYKTGTQRRVEPVQRYETGLISEVYSKHCVQCTYLVLHWKGYVVADPR